MPEFSDREQLLELKLFWMQNRLKGLENQIFGIFMYSISLDYHLQQSNKLLEQLAAHLEKCDELREYILADIAEISQEIKSLEQL